MSNTGDDMDLVQSSILQPAAHNDNISSQGLDVSPNLPNVTVGISSPVPHGSDADVDDDEDEEEDDEEEDDDDENEDEEDDDDEDVMDTTPDHSQSPISPSQVIVTTTDAEGQIGNVNPPPDHVTPNEAESSSEEDYDEDYEEDWHEIPEDKSTLSVQELEEFAARAPPTATDHQFFENQLIKGFEDPEYRLGTMGRASFAVNKFNGTKDSPNTELLMKSPTFDIGSYSFQIKVFPRGNGTDYLSVFLECVSLGGNGGSREKTRFRTRSHRVSKKSTGPAQTVTSVISTPPLHTPVLMRDNTKAVLQRPSVAANIVIVAYNPKDPRVYIRQDGTHRFSPKSPDWGWPRFHGPYYELGRRQPGMPAPLLQDDKMCFTAYIRLIEDDTGCFQEHPYHLNPWDSFLMTGLQAMVTVSRSPRSLVSAVSAWMLLKPFRQFLYDSPVMDHDFNEKREKPMLMLMALKTVVLDFTTLSSRHGDIDTYSPVSLGPIENALLYYGINDVVAKCDVIELWEVIRTLLEEELSGTPFQNSLQQLFGPKVDRKSNSQAFRVGVKGAGSMQNSIDRTPAILPPDTLPPPILQLELERQQFDEKERDWEKVGDTITIDDHINVGGQSYILYGIITHNGGLQSGQYFSILRPNGPNHGWFQFTDKKYPDANFLEKLVQRLTQREAIDRHQGGPKMDRETGPPLAYVALYVRSDVSVDAFDFQSEPAWDPSGIKTYGKMMRSYVDQETMVYTNKTLVDPEKSSDIIDHTPESISYQVRAINSASFVNWTGPGIVNLQKLENAHQFTLPMSATAEDLREKIASLEQGVIHPVQIKMWSFAPLYGQQSRPYLDRNGTSDEHPFGQMRCELSDFKGNADRVSAWCWYHVHDQRELNTLLKEDEIRQKRKIPAEPLPAIHLIFGAGPATTTIDTQPNRHEDTIMSDPDEPIVSNLAFTVPPTQRNGGLQVGMPPPPMGLNRLPAPPTSGSSRNITLPNWAKYMQSNPDNPEIYFFLKIWDPEKQQLVANGSYFAKYKDRIDHVVFKCLGISRDHSRPIWVENSLTATTLIKRRKTFEDLRLGPGCIIVIREKPTAQEDEYASSIFGKHGFLELQTFLRVQAQNIAFPDRTDTSATYTLNYFGQEYYKGPLLYHEPTGAGQKIDFAGNQYTGNFKLGERHGMGKVLHLNGDVYEGEFERDQYSGKGRFVTASTGNIYEGGFLEGRPHGAGVTHWQKAEEGDGVCSMCWDEQVDAVLLNCGHVVGCLMCSKRLDHCPVCRKKVSSAIKVYWAAAKGA